MKLEAPKTLILNSHEGWVFKKGKNCVSSKKNTKKKHRIRCLEWKTKEWSGFYPGKKIAHTSQTLPMQQLLCQEENNVEKFCSEV